jgi:coenzyme F420-reducing hydrogenase beta subunit
MKIQEISKECHGCTACATVCPVKCISMEADTEGFYKPVINESQCIGCGKCDTVCMCVNVRSTSDTRTAYYGNSLIDDVLKSSSSGGVFRHMADVVLGDGGVIYGAIFDRKTRQVRHCSTDEVPIELLQKSKYVESYLGTSFQEIQNHILNGRKVLFCGTPCQVAGLKSVVSDTNGFLVTCDFICHGVPSSKLFQEHLSHLHGENDILALDFRPKDRGWATDNIMLCTKTLTKTRIKPYYLDSYFAGFMKHNAFLRKSCYNCQFRRNHYSDVTIADFWGYKKFDDLIDSKKGLSLIITNTQKGENIINRLSNFDLHLLDFKYAEYVYAEKDYSNAYELRKLFFELYDQYGFEKAAKKAYLSGMNFEITRIKYYIKKIIGRE